MFSTIPFNKSKVMLLILLIGFSVVALSLGNSVYHKAIADTNTNTNQTNQNTNTYTTSDSNTKEFTLIAQ
ncbi:MAG TPA: hypothetical protein VFT71_01435, partial [Candidatus Nitrosocosmicus sp.]|nr:hypothetical protein [Candidatus Nitrosocosmicus sp.]